MRAPSTDVVQHDGFPSGICFPVQPVFSQGIPVTTDNLHVILYKARSCWAGSTRATHGFQLVGKPTAVWCHLLWMLVVPLHFFLAQRQRIWKPVSWFFFCLSLTPPQHTNILLLAWANTLPLPLWGYSIPRSTSSENAWHLQGIGKNNQLAQTSWLKSWRPATPWLLTSQPASNECYSLKKQAEITLF